MIYDAMFYRDQPSLIRRGLRPAYFVYDGTLNRATADEADSANAGEWSDFAWRRVARDAIGVERGIPQHQGVLPASYDRIEQPVVIDVESSPVVQRMWSEKVDDPDRRAGVAWLCRSVDAMRHEAKGYGRVLTVGAYHPLLPFANDPAARAAAEADFRPYLDRIDVPFPSFYFDAVDLDRWASECDRKLADCGRIMPGKPVVPVVCPFNVAAGHEWVPVEFWRDAMRLLTQRAIAGVCLWGGVQWKDNPDGTARFPFGQVEPYIAAITEGLRDTVPGGGH
jgi:hypothetical protein